MTPAEREALLRRKRDLEADIARTREELAHLESNMADERIKELEGVLLELRQQVTETRGRVASGFGVWRVLPIVAVCGVVLGLVFLRGCT